MSTWTSSTGLLLGMAVLAGCRLDPAALLRPATAPAAVAASSRADGPPPQRMALADSEVVVAGPRGFCIDRGASRDDDVGALAVLSSCRMLGAGLFAPAPAHPAILTAAVAPAGPPMRADSRRRIAEFLQTDAGRAMLSRAGQAETVQVREVRVEQEAVLARIADTAPFAWGAVQPEYWRGLTELGGRMITVSVLAMPDAPMSPDEGLETLLSFLAATREATARDAKPKG